MTISVTTDLTTITGAESTTDSGTFYRLNGTSSANPAQDLDAFVQGTACIANKLGSTISPTDAGGHFNHASTFDLTGKHLYHWRQIVTAGNMLTKANQGVSLGLTNTSTTSTTTWSTTNYKKWYLDGSDTVKASKGWECYVVDPSGAADASAGTLTLSSVKNIGFICRQNSSVTTTVSNQFLDAVRAGTGITASANSAADTIKMSDVYATDSLTSNMWGIVNQNSGIYYLSGKINIGSAAQANVCNFTDSDQVAIWRDFPVGANFYEIAITGNASFATTVQLTGWVIRGQAGKSWNLNCNTGGVFKSYSSSFANIGTAALSASSILDSTSFSACGTIDANGALITGCSFADQTATQLKVDTTAEMSNIHDDAFNSDGTGHAIELTVAGTYQFSNLTFIDFAATNGSTGNEAVFVNVATGNVTINVSGGTTPSIRTAGATVTVVSGSVSVSMAVTDVAGAPIASAQVMIKAAVGGYLPVNAVVTISNSSTTATVTHTAHGLSTNDKVLIKGASHWQNNGVFSITVLNANQYTYTMLSAPGGNPTGTITSTFVALYGSTNASGQISMSRVFSSNQPVTGWARKSSAQPYFKTGQVSGTVLSGSGASLSTILIADE
jgi:hypothetical protein